MPEGEAVRGQQPFRVGRAHSRLQNSRVRDRIHRHQRVEPAQVERDHRDLVAAQRGHPADHRRPTAEGHNADPVFGADQQDLLHLCRIGGRDHRIGRGDLARSPEPQ